MLKWFADRLAQTGKNVRKDERGFTLIELLVVVIIIGILAAIAIPTFLAQRGEAESSAARADLRTAGTAEQAAFTATGSYRGPDQLADYGFTQSTPATVTGTGSGNSYCLQASGGGDTWYMSQAKGTPDQTDCAAATP